MSKNLFADESVLDRRTRAAATVDHSEQVGFISSKDVITRVSLAANRRAAADVLTKLSKDSDWGVRAAVAKNPATPAAVKVALKSDSNSFVRDAAR